MVHVVTHATLKQFWSNINFSKDCWIWKGPLSSDKGNGKQYPQMWSRGEDGKISEKLGCRRLSYFIHFGVWPDKQVRTTCGNPLCVSPLHLTVEVGTEVYRKFQTKSRVKHQKHTPELAKRIHAYRSLGRTWAWISNKVNVTAPEAMLIHKMVKFCRTGKLKPKRRKQPIGTAIPSA